MKRANESKIFRKNSIEYLKKAYRNSVSYMLGKTGYGENSQRGLFSRTRKSLKKVGEDLKIFRAPSIVGIKIIYHKSLSYLFDSSELHKRTPVSEDKFLLRDLTGSPKPDEKELKIFRFPNIDYLERLYFGSEKRTIQLKTNTEL